MDHVKETITGYLPVIHVNSIGMGFFRTTNLLLPGGRPAIHFDSNLGPGVPGGLLLVGTVAQSMDDELYM